jgi:ribonuclease HI
MKIAMIFTDGAAKGNPGPGGYGAVISYGETVVELGEGKSVTTNNEMELRAVVAALRSLPKEVRTAAVYTDSKYVVEGATGWVFGWMKNGWKTKTGSEVLHKEIWQELVSLLSTVKVDWHKVPGHVGIIGNERADTIASDLGMGKAVDLYTGPRSGYSYEIENVSYDTEKEAARSAARKRQSAKAYSYISAVDGEVMVHQTWQECEARVKGKQGVRYKKALSAAEEKEIVTEFSK